MINYKRITIIFSLIFFCILVSYFFFSKRMVNGIMAGYWTGVFHFFFLSFIVKKIFGIINEMAASKVVKVLVVYLLKIAFFAIVIFLIVLKKQIFSIIGFLLGFTFTVIIIFIESLILKKA